MGFKACPMRAVSPWLVLAGLCLCAGFNGEEDSITQLPPTGEDAPQQDPTLKADKSFLAAQEALKQAAAVPNPDPDDYGLADAKQAAEAAAFSEEADTQSLGDSMLVGEIGLKHKSHSHHVDAIMGKLIMSDLFSNKELGDIKNALVSQSHSHKNLGESNKQADPDHVALAKGLSVALQDKARAQKKIHAVEEQLARAKKAHSVNAQLNAATLNTKSEDMHKQFLTVNAKLQKAETRHHVTKRGFEMCDKREEALQAQVRSLKTSALEQLAKQSNEKVNTASNSNVSPCCQACAKLSSSERTLVNADCSGC